MVWSWLVDFVWPPQSLTSAQPVSRPGLIDPEGFLSLRFITPPYCARCGLPLETAEAAPMLCGVCVAEPPVFEAARAALVYNDAARDLILDLKRGGRRDGLALFGGWMARAGADILTPDALICPVPLHWTRLMQRRFNQAAWLAEALGKAGGYAVRRDLLVRRKARRSQGGLSAAARRRNVAGAFALPQQRQPLVDGRTVVLIDDVYTTGATASACARALKRGGAARIVVIALARVVKPSDLAV